MPRSPRGARQTPGPSLADDALALAASGWPVFPCNPDKSPRTSRGFHDASTDAETVAAMDWAGALVGVAIPEGHVVLDVDPRNGGDDTMAALKQAGHRIPKTRVVRTGGGGTHYYFRAPDGVELRAHLGEGVDVKRAGRGYVIAPPSEGYSVLRSDEPAPLPEWLADVLEVEARDGATYEAHAPKFFAWESGTAYGLAALKSALEDLADAGAGGRNDALNRAAFGLAQLVAGGELEEEATIAALEAAALDIGLTPSETAKTLRSAWEAGSDDPRQAPPRETADAEASSPIIQPTTDESRFWLDWNVEEEPPAFLLDPVLPEGAYVLVYGPAEASKSMVFAALGAQASHLGIRTTLYSLENPSHVDRDRLRRLGPNPDNFRATNEPLDLNDPAQFEAMVEREKAWGTRLVVIDTYSHAFESRTEDGNARAIAFARRIRFLMHEVGCAVVVIDHTGYVHDEPRDASAKRQQVDVCILMESGGDWQPGKPARFLMENRKAARFGNPFTLSGEIRGNRGEPLELVWTGKAPTWAA